MEVNALEMFLNIFNTHTLVLKIADVLYKYFVFIS